ncbi:phage tail tape measure protein [Aurantimonas sp. A2-1-M11]|uniref:phage tail tape measure protein n=1 Tax=Aurantimonas sp. A2-1-M11 TaxID=3113712 RepID=UPI002F947779
MTILDSLVVMLGLKYEGDGERKKFEQGLKGVEGSASAMVGKLARMGAVAGGAMATVGAAAVREFAGVERTLTYIGNSAEVADERMAHARRQLQSMADDMGYDGLDQPVRALDALIAKNVEFEKSMSMMPAILGTAMATDSAPTDIANSAVTIAENFGIAGDQMQLAFDILAKGGKEGAFELKDMAGELPSLAPAFKALGYEGTEGLSKLVSLLQTVRLETGTSAEAANRFENVMAKLNVEQTRKSFADFGIDLPAEMETNMLAGMDRMDSFIAATAKALQGNMDQINTLFTDVQVAQGMRALVGNREKLAGFEKSIQDASGTIAPDLERVLANTQTDIDRTLGAWKRFKTELGSTLAPAAGGVLGSLADDLSDDAAQEEGLRRRGVEGFYDQWREIQRLTSSLQEEDPDLWRYQANELAGQRLAAEGRGDVKASDPLFDSSGQVLLKTATDAIIAASNTVTDAVARMPRIDESFSATAGGTSDVNAAALQQGLANMAAHFEAMQGPAAAAALNQSIANTDNRNQSVNVGAPQVTVNVQEASQAPAAVGAAVGRAVGQAAVQTRPGVAASAAAP